MCLRNFCDLHTVLFLFYFAFFVEACKGFGRDSHLFFEGSGKIVAVRVAAHIAYLRNGQPLLASVG